MSVPKRKTGRSVTHARRSANTVLKPAARALCEQCGAVKLPHYVCGNCGSYNGREVLSME
ncbi:MAG: 50S ribosomal protein L32 [Coriobacteriales bacterium]|jgi:large subunit ribosomal protein L32|nr:50S ribosomal protein L32 [Coriobacteriales bacterium]